MNADQVNSIDLTEILQKIGHVIVKKKGSELWYYSPFRQEKTPSFHVNLSKNVWYDFGENIGGRPVDFICTYLENQNEDHTVADALRWSNNMFAFSNPKKPPYEDDFQNEATLKIRKVCSLQEPLLASYLNSRGIPLISAKKYLKEVYVHSTTSGKSFFALGLRNIDGGYELRNKFFKGCIAPKTISFIRGTRLFHEEIHVFEGFMDFLSALSHQKANRFEGDAIILNSISCLSQAFPYIKNYSYKSLHAWLDNDPAGERASLALKDFADEQGLLFKPMNNVYAPHKDVNQWHMHKLGL